MNVENFIESLGENEFKSELQYCDLDNIIKKDLLRTRIRKIVELADNKRFEASFSETAELLMLMLKEYVASKMEDKDEYWFIEFITYFIHNKDEELRGILTSINAEFHLVDKPCEQDVTYLLNLVCRTYDMLFERYGELEFGE